MFLADCSLIGSCFCYRQARQGQKREAYGVIARRLIKAFPHRASNLSKGFEKKYQKLQVHFLWGSIIHKGPIQYSAAIVVKVPDKQYLQSLWRLFFSPFIEFVLKGAVRKSLPPRKSPKRLLRQEKRSLHIKCLLCSNTIYHSSSIEPYLLQQLLRSTSSSKLPSGRRSK